MAYSLIDHIETDYYGPPLQTILRNGVHVLDLATSLENFKFFARGMEGQGIHSRCGEGRTSQPLGEAEERLRSLVLPPGTADPV